MSVGATEQSSARGARASSNCGARRVVYRLGKALGLTRARTHQIVWKAIVDDGLRSKRARAWMAKLDAGGYWLKRYDEKFRKPSKPLSPKTRRGTARTPT